MMMMMMMIQCLYNNNIKVATNSPPKIFFQKKLSACIVRRMVSLNIWLRGYFFFILNLLSMKFIVL